jgi:hypothetical protein
MDEQLTAAQEMSALDACIEKLMVDKEAANAGNLEILKAKQDAIAAEMKILQEKMGDLGNAQANELVESMKSKAQEAAELVRDCKEKLASINAMLGDAETACQSTRISPRKEE